MTREEREIAITNLEGIKRNYIEGYGYEEHPLPEYYAIEAGIEALKQEACDDIAKDRYNDLCEYFGESKDILNSREEFKEWLERVKWHIKKADELSRAQEPCNDCVSREEIKQVVKGLATECAFDRPSFDTKEGYKVIPTKYHKGYEQALIDIEEKIKALPPVQPKQKWIADNATNGDVIKAMFDCMVIGISNGEVYVEKIYFPFDEEWWNAPYKENKE